MITASICIVAASLLETFKSLLHSAGIAPGVPGSAGVTARLKNQTGI
jgi:hypothetical protein